MYGSNVKALNVYLKTGSTLGKPVWTHNGTRSNKWYQARVDIQGNTTYQIMFEGVRGVSYKGDIALDDISVPEGPCAGRLKFIPEFDNIFIALSVRGPVI